MAEVDKVTWDTDQNGIIIHSKVKQLSNRIIL